MALDPRIALAGVQPQFSLFDLGKVLQRGQQLQGTQMELAEYQRQLQEAAAVRSAYAQSHGGGGGGGAGGAPPGLAGVTPMAPGPETPIMERQLGGGPTAMAPYATEPPSGPQAPTQGLAGLQGAFGGAPGSPAAGPGQQQAFIQELYRISPKAGMAAEDRMLKQHLDRVEYLGRVAEGVLAAESPQAAHEVGRQMLLEYGMPPGQIPATFDKQLWSMYAGVARDSADKLRLAQARHAEAEAELAPLQEQRLQRQYALDVEKYGLQQAQELRQERQAEETARHHRATEAQAGAAAGVAQTKEQAARENELRDEFNTLSKDYRTVSDAYSRIQSAQETGPGDISLIFSYMKLLDPGSTVREGEFATAQNAGGVPERIIAQYNRLRTGERLAPETRKEFLQQSQGLYDRATKDYEKTRTQYQDLARRSGADPANVTLEYGSTAPPRAEQEEKKAASARRPHEGIPVSQMTPEQLDDLEAWVRAQQQKGAR